MAKFSNFNSYREYMDEQKDSMFDSEVKLTLRDFVVIFDFLYFMSLGDDFFDFLWSFLLPEQSSFLVRWLFEDILSFLN